MMMTMMTTMVMMMMWPDGLSCWVNKVDGEGDGVGGFNGLCW